MTLGLRGWASQPQLAQIAKDYRAAIAMLEQRTWEKFPKGDPGDKASPLSAVQALGITCGKDDGNLFSSRISLALSACYRSTGLLLVDVNDKAQTWSELRSILDGIAEEADRASYTTGVSRA